ncbi:MAG: NUDIX domain-containing protein [Asticcacaulis sp.]
MSADALNAYGARQPGLTYAPRAAAYAIITRSDGCLALMRQGGKLDLPGGGIEAGETPEQAVVRECLEEAGFVVEVRGFVGEALQYFINTDGRPYANHARIYVAECVAERPEAKVEMDHETEWLTPQDALISLEKEGYAVVLLSWMRGA